MNSKSLSIQNVSVFYGKTQILHDISFEMEKGEVFGLIGQNGAGKTTLIRSILGLTPSNHHQESKIEIFDTCSTSHEARKKIVYMPEKFIPSAQLKGWEYLKILKEYYNQKLDKNAALKMAEGLAFPTEALDRKGNTYSKGMGQKLGLMGTMLTELPLLILDEPMSGLDPLARAMLKDRLLEYKADSNHSIFFSSHILADIEEICDRIGVIHEGKLIFLGTPKEFIKKHEASSLERSFLKAITEKNNHNKDKHAA
ncbi:MAG: ABC transporter ATP-binding protein [Alphaproteobacteria bacterium]|nr:ABC transporter ATP-binding protein [Alphaproteobacteria bacterium]